MTTTQRLIRVYADWAGLNGPQCVGVLAFDRVRGKNVFSFEYTADWLSSGRALEIDPDLRLYRGQHYLGADKLNFGVFMDSSPDRWGRLLMRRREAFCAKSEKRPVRPLSEVDYLLGVYDRQRMGAIRFQEGERDEFLTSDQRLASPPWTSLRELEHASLMFEREDEKTGASELKWLNQLLAPGSSLGGARPKAGVVDDKDALWIAKFPSRSDMWDMGTWEFVIHGLARRAGLCVPDAQCLKLTSHHHTFLSKRFDRRGDGQRLHFASAMTLTGHIDGTDAAAGASYLELSDFIIRHGTTPSVDLAEIWSRMVFNMCVCNTDDHLRNHGFLLADHNGWRLAPAYDINANPGGDSLTLNITESDNRLDLDLALEVAESFRLKMSEARKRIAEIRKAVSTWRTSASRMGLSRSEQEEMTPAFRLAEN